MPPKIDLFMHSPHDEHHNERNHGHTPQGRRAGADREPTAYPTLLLVSAWQRLLLAGLMLAPLWLAVAWALND